MHISGGLKLMEQEFIKVNGISLVSQLRNELKRLGIESEYKDVLGFLNLQIKN